MDWLRGLAMYRTRILICNEETTDDYESHCCSRLWNPDHIPLGGVNGAGLGLEARQF